MRETAVYGTAVVGLAAVANLLHVASYVGRDVVTLRAWQWAYVIGVIYLASIVAAVLLWTPYRLAGACSLLVSMAGSFVFDFAYYYLIDPQPRKHLHPATGRVTGTVPGLGGAPRGRQRDRGTSWGLGCARTPLAPAGGDGVQTWDRILPACFADGDPMIRGETRQVTGVRTFDRHRPLLFSVTRGTFRPTCLTWRSQAGGYWPSATCGTRISCASSLG